MNNAVHKQLFMKFKTPRKHALWAYKVSRLGSSFCFLMLTSSCWTPHCWFFMMTNSPLLWPRFSQYIFQGKLDDIFFCCDIVLLAFLGKGAFRCTSCLWSYSLLGGKCNSDCFVGEYKVQETPGQEVPICRHFLLWFVRWTFNFSTQYERCSLLLSEFKMAYI